MATKRRSKQPRRHRFFLNPYSDMRFTRCPKCGGTTRQRKLPLVIHVDPMNLIVLNKTCRYCPLCDLLIAHQDDLEAQLAAHFAERNPDVIGNDYLVLGTVDRPDWQRGRGGSLTPRDVLETLHEFKDVWRFEVVGGGWVPDPAKP